MTSNDRFQWGASSDVGRVRSINQDAMFVAPTLFVVADGMGGHRAGEVASAIAVDGFDESGVDTTNDLKDRIVQANRNILEAANNDPDMFGMGTTLTALALPTNEGDDLVVANVGDSRAYVFRDGEITQVSEDHSLVGDLVREGRLTEEEAAHHPRRNVVTRALGIEDPVAVDTFPVPLVAGDRFVLCSDGLTDEVPSSAIAGALRRLREPQEVADELVRMANEAGGRDNVTVVVVDVLNPDASVSGVVVDHEADAEPVLTATAAAPTKSETSDGPQPKRRLITGRSIAFVLALLAVAAVSLFAVNAAATGTYFVGFDGDDVVIYQGRPGGLLWFDPTIEEPTTLTRDDVPANQVDRLDAGVDQDSLEAAQRFVANLEQQASTAADVGPSVTTTPSTTTEVSSQSTVTTVPPPTSES